MISLSEFRQRYRVGIDTSPQNTSLDAALQSADTNGDQLVAGAELMDLYASINSDNALLDLDRRTPGRDRLVTIARGFRDDPRLAEGYRPSQRMLSLNRMHNGRVRADGLVRTNYERTFKCNLFVGDVLERAGLSAPKIHNPSAGWTHFRYAEQWRHSSQFEVIPREKARPGDILAVDYLNGEGSGGGHLEVITDTTGEWRSIGARSFEDAVVEDTTKTAILLEGKPQEDGGYYDAEAEVAVYVLRHRSL